MLMLTCFALFERSEFAAFPLTGSGFWEPVGQPLRGRLFLGYFFLAKQKEVTGCRAAPGLVVTECIQDQLPPSEHLVQCPSVIAPTVINGRFRFARVGT